VTASTLRLWLAGPLQAWGVASRFEVRTTELAPSKSGVLGLVCAALGRPRSAPIDDLATLRFGVRVEQPGSVLRDYHTVGAGVRAGGIAVASGAKARGIQTERFYLQDAAFVAGLEGHDEALLSELHRALASPRWLLGLGRRSCVPAGPLVDNSAIFDGDLEAALRTPWRPAGQAERERVPAWPYEREELTQLILEDPDGEVELQDQPLGSAFEARTFAVRRARSTWVPLEAGD
jgi:CRISPR system Cascade subunit CasD